MKVNDFTCWVRASVSGKTPDLLFVVPLFLSSFSFFLCLPKTPVSFLVIHEGFRSLFDFVETIGSWKSPLLYGESFFLSSVLKIQCASCKVLSETSIFIGRRKQTFDCFIIQPLFRCPIEHPVFSFWWRPVNGCSILEELFLLSLLLLLLLLLLPFGMISIFSLLSSHDDAVAIVVEFDDNFWLCTRLIG